MASLPDRFADFRVLLVEDDPQAMNLVRTMLNDLGIYQVHTAANGLKAKIFLEGEDTKDLANVVLCDWNMPVISGIDLLRHVRLENQDLPFLMITGQANEASVREARSVGVTGYILKPFTTEDLRRKLQIVQSILSLRTSGPTKASAAAPSPD